MSVLRGLRHHQSALGQPLMGHTKFGAMFPNRSFCPPAGHGRGGVHILVAVGHGVWKTSEPLSDLDQLLNIAKHDPFMSARWVVGVCSAQQRLVYHVPNGLPMRYSRRGAEEA